MPRRVSWMICLAFHWQCPLIVCWPLRSPPRVFPLRNVSDLDCPVTQKCEVSGDAPWCCCTAVGGWVGPRIPFHTSVNVVWFYCHFLWWKVINPFPSPSPPNCVSASQHPWPVEREHRGADKVLVYPRRDGVFLGSPRSFTTHQAFSKTSLPPLGIVYMTQRPLNTVFPLPFFFFLFYLFTEALPCSPLMRNWFRFFKTGLEVLSATRVVIILCNIENCF